MADRTLSKNEIVLNSVKFPISGFVREQLISRFPQKLITGEYDFANEQILSNFITSDQRGGMLIEEMDEAIHQDRYWWSTSETRFRSNILLGPLTTALNDPAAGNLTIANADMELDSDWTGGARSSTEKHGGTYSWKTEKAGDSPGNDDATQAITTFNPGVEYTFKCWVYVPTVGASAGHAHIRIGDGTTTVESSAVAEGGSFAQVTAVITPTVDATTLTLTLRTTSTSGDATLIIGYFDDATLTATAVSVGTAIQQANFNSEAYSSFGTLLAKLNSGNTGFDLVADIGTTITDLVVTSDGVLMVCLGDSTNYFTMATSEVFTETNVSLANKALRWDGKTWKMTVDGRWFSSSNPSNATPTWTAADASGGLDDYALTPKSLVVYFDANGNQIPYCATTKGLYAFSVDDSKWIETALELPEHDQTGLGLVVWHNALHVSGGLGVSKYISGSTAVITEIGLTRDDGMPQLRSGEIVKFIKGYNEFFALVDSTYEGTGSRSQVVSWDGRGWRTWWEATADNKNMYSGIVTSVNKHQLLFSTTDGVYRNIPASLWF